MRQILGVVLAILLVVHPAICQEGSLVEQTACSNVVQFVSLFLKLTSPNPPCRVIGSSTTNECSSRGYTLGTIGASVPCQSHCLTLKLCLVSESSAAAASESISISRCPHQNRRNHLDPPPTAILPLASLTYPCDSRSSLPAMQVKVRSMVKGSPPAEVVGVSASFGGPVADRLRDSPALPLMLMDSKTGCNVSSRSVRFPSHLCTGRNGYRMSSAIWCSRSGSGLSNPSQCHRVLSSTVTARRTNVCLCGEACLQWANRLTTSVES